MTIRVGIVGCGNIFTMHATSAYHLNNAEIVGVCDIKKERADKQAEKYNVKAYYDYKDLIKKELIDVVHVCTPNRSHSFISIDAMEAGKHVMCEKPMAKTAADAKRKT